MGLIDSRAHSGLEGKEGRLSMGRCPGVAPGFIIRAFQAQGPPALLLAIFQAQTRLHGNSSLMTKELVTREKSRRDTLEAAGHVGTRLKGGNNKARGNAPGECVDFDLSPEGAC